MFVASRYINNSEQNEKKIYIIIIKGLSKTDKIHKAGELSYYHTEMKRPSRLSKVSERTWNDKETFGSFTKWEH